MLMLALPLGEQAWLAWFMLVPLLWTTKEKGFLIGFLSGLGAVFWCGFLATTGVFYQTKTFEPDSAWTYTACGLFASSFALFFAIWGDSKNHTKPVWWFAALAVCLESILLLKLPAPLALTQYRNPAMMFVTSGAGVWGVSFLIWYLNVACVKSVSSRIVTGLVLVISVIATKSVHPPQVTGGILVGATQIAEGQDRELSDSHQEASRLRPALVVWPEFSGMNFVHNDDTSKLKQWSLISSPIVTSFQDKATPLPHNVAALFANGQESKRYEKRKLFGKESDLHTPGLSAVAVLLTGTQETVGLNICYDSCFPYVIRETAALTGVNFIALPTIDPDSRHYFIAGIHAAFTPFRCAENGVAMVRADGHYGSMIVNEKGQIVAELKNEQKTLIGTISGRRAWTLYQTIGDSFWFLCILGVIAYPIVTWAKNRKAKLSALESVPPK